MPENKRDFSDLKECVICSKKCANLNGLSIHLKFKHQINVPDYIVQHLTKEVFLCKCGCKQKAKWWNGRRFQDYLTGHFTKTALFDNPWKKPRHTWSPPNKRAWSDSEFEEIYRLFIEEHKNLGSIGVKFGCSKNSIARILDMKFGKKKRIEIGRQNDSWRKKNIPEMNQRICAAAAKGGCSYSFLNNTSIERKMKVFLDELGIRHKFKFQFFLKDFQTQQTFCYDFGSAPSKVLIECDGNYWHANPVYYPQPNEAQQRIAVRDKLKAEAAIRNGYKLIRFWETEINDNPETVKQQINEVLCQPKSFSQQKLLTS
jgi:very-short-patch-repair endonuclease